MGIGRYFLGTVVVIVAGIVGGMIADTVGGTGGGIAVGTGGGIAVGTAVGIVGGTVGGIVDDTVDGTVGGTVDRIFVGIVDGTVAGTAVGIVGRIFADTVGGIAVGTAVGTAVGMVTVIVVVYLPRSLISGLPPEYEALIECESEGMDIEKPDHIVKRLEDDLEYIEQKQRAEYELTQDGCDILDCQELGQKLKAAGYVQYNQTDSDNNTFEITEEGQKIIERNDDLCEVLKDDLEYIEQKQRAEYELIEDGYPVAIKSRQRIEKTNLNLYVIAVSALGIGVSLLIYVGSNVDSVSTLTQISILAIVLAGVLLIGLPIIRSKVWTR